MRFLSCALFAGAALTFFGLATMEELPSIGIKLSAVLATFTLLAMIGVLTSFGRSPPT
jgi:hypothetical protein